MSSYYLCETCAINKGYPNRTRLCWYKYCDCPVYGVMRMLIMHDGIERPEDLCEHYEREERYER